MEETFIKTITQNIGDHNNRNCGTIDGIYRDYLKVELMSEGCKVI